jgi:hypothetical protein
VIAAVIAAVSGFSHGLAHEAGVIFPKPSMS